jgi:hypothetical protein
LFQLKISSSRRGAFASTRCTHPNCKNKEHASQQSSYVPEIINTSPKRSSFTNNLSEEATTY